jgi:predicted PurR-regulated permease PerM
MKLLQVLIFFLLFFIAMAGLSVPLWWNYAQPVIFALPDYINNVMKIIKDYWNIFDNILKQH